jgi:hypothetical protein
LGWAIESVWTVSTNVDHGEVAERLEHRLIGLSSTLVQSVSHSQITDEPPKGTRCGQTELGVLFRLLFTELFLIHVDLAPKRERERDWLVGDKCQSSCR